jgi:hypothetical protein
MQLAQPPEPEELARLQAAPVERGERQVEMEMLPAPPVGQVVAVAERVIILTARTGQEEQVLGAK